MRPLLLAVLALAGCGNNPETRPFIYDVPQPCSSNCPPGTICPAACPEVAP